MAPIVYTDDDSMMDQKQLFFEASVLHRIPPELLVQSSSSTRYLQSFPNGMRLLFLFIFKIVFYLSKNEAYICCTCGSISRI